MNVSDFASSYEAPHRQPTHAPSSRSFQPATSHMDMHTLPIFSTQSMTTTVPYQSGVFAYDSLATNPYNMQQAFSVNYPTTMAQNIPYAGTSTIQPLPASRTARNGFAAVRPPVVKSESTSPVQSHHTFTETSYGGEYKRSTSEPSENTNINFATDVDTLMKAIQAKQTNAPSTEPPKVCSFKEPCFSVSNHQHRKRKFDQVDGRQNATSVPSQSAEKPFTKRHILIFTDGHTPATSLL